MRKCMPRWRPRWSGYSYHCKGYHHQLNVEATFPSVASFGCTLIVALRNDSRVCCLSVFIICTRSIKFEARRQRLHSSLRIGDLDDLPVMTAVLRSIVPLSREIEY